MNDRKIKCLLRTYSHKKKIGHEITTHGIRSQNVRVCRHATNPLCHGGTTELLLLALNIHKVIRIRECNSCIADEFTFISFRDFVLGVTIYASDWHRNSGWLCVWMFNCVCDWDGIYVLVPVSNFVVCKL